MIDERVPFILQLNHNAAQRGVLAFWTVYDHPKDYPHGFCARRHDVPGGPQDCYLMAPLEELRSVFEGAGLHCLPRAEGDDSKIVETWI
jgi:hypothetical protein